MVRLRLFISNLFIPLIRLIRRIHIRITEGVTEEGTRLRMAALTVWRTVQSVVARTAVLAV